MIVGVLPRPPRFLTIEEVFTLHQAAVDQYGGSYDLRDRGLLESALAMPRQSFGGRFAHEVPFGMGAAYAFHICKNHPFVDGNKRTAFAALFLFLRYNGWDLSVSEEEAADRIVEVATDRLDKAGLTAWLAAQCRARPSLELRDFFAELGYASLSSTFEGIAAGSADERVATIQEAGRAIPAIHAANIGAIAAESGGDPDSGMILRQHSMLLTALYRIAGDMGYEW